MSILKQRPHSQGHIPAPSLAISSIPLFSSNHKLPPTALSPNVTCPGHTGLPPPPPPTMHPSSITIQGGSPVLELFPLSLLLSLGPHFQTTQGRHWSGVDLAHKCAHSSLASALGLLLRATPPDLLSRLCPFHSMPLVFTLSEDPASSQSTPHPNDMVVSEELSCFCLYCQQPLCSEPSRT